MEDWTYSEYQKAIDLTKKERHIMVSLDTEHCTSLSDKRLVNYAEKDGYKTEVRSDCVIIYLIK